MHHIAFAIKLAENAVIQAVAFHPAPEFKLITWDCDEIECQVVRSECVHSTSATLCINLIEFVFDDRTNLFLIRFERSDLCFDLFGFLRAICRLCIDLSQFCFQCRKRSRVDSALLTVHRSLEVRSHLRQCWRVIGGIPRIINFSQKKPLILSGPHILIHRIPKRLLLGTEFSILLRVAGSDCVGPFEHHVLEEVRNACNARAFVGAADFGKPASRNSVWLVGPRDENKFHPVFKGEYLRGQLLRLSRKCGQSSSGECENSSEGQFHRFLQLGGIYL